MSEHVSQLRRRIFRFALCSFTTVGLFLNTACGLLPEEPVYERAPVAVAYTQSPYEYTTVQRGDIEIRQSVRFEYEPTQEAVLAFNVGGLLIEGIYVNQGSQVTEGQILAELEAADIDLQYSQAEDAIARLELEILQTKENQALERRMLQADLKHATAADLKERLTTLDDGHKKHIQQLEDRLYIQNLELDQMEALAAERRLVAPFDATVSYVREIREGSRSISGENMIKLAVSESSMFVGKTDIPQYFTPGTELQVTVGDDELPVVAIDPEEYGLDIEPETSSWSSKNDEFYVYLSLQAENIVLESGTRANVSILLDASRDSLLIDKDALHFSEEQAFVYVESEDGLREVEFIEIGLSNNDFVEVLSGLEEGERIILD